MAEFPLYVRVPTEQEKSYFTNSSAAEAVIGAIINAQNQGWLRLHGFVVLPDALEMVTSPIRQGISGVIAHLQAEMMPVLNALLPDAMFVWSVRFQHTPIQTQKALNARLDMLVLSPVAAGLCEKAEDYPFSSANARYRANVAVYAGFARMLPLDEGSFISGGGNLNDPDNSH
jgi:hypothetical protein